MYHIQITKRAERDIQDTLAYISETLHNPSAALDLFDEAEKQLQSLSDLPDRNPLVHDAILAANGIRIQLINNYIAFYIINEAAKTVTIIRFMYSRRNWMSILKEDL